MRLLTLICACLIIANVVAYFWPDKANYAAHIHNPKEDVNPHFVRLNKEIEDKFYSQPATAFEVVADEMLAASAPTIIGEANCYRVGPFMHQANYELAQAVLFNAEIEYQKSKRASKQSNVFRVYLGPYSSQALVSDARVELKRKNVLDHFVRKESAENYIISLGIYTTVESADEAVALFSENLDNVNIKDEVVVLPDSFWLHFSVDDDDQAHQQLSRIDWGEQSAKMGKYQCQI